MGMSERIKERRIFMGYTQEELGEKLGLQKSAIAKYENGRVENIKRSIIANMAKVLDCSPAYLMGWSDKACYELSDKANEVTSSEFERIKKYRDLDSHGKEMVDFTLQKEWERSTLLKPAAISSIHNASTRLINYYYRLASAGTGQIIFDMPPTKRIEIPNIPEYRKVDYAISVNGNSMEPTFYDGDLLLIEMTEEVDPGEIGIFLVDNESYVKKLGKGELISLNPECDNIPLTEDSRCMGRVIDKLENS